MTTYNAAIGSHFLPALINGDYSGLEDHEIIAIDRWSEEYFGAIYDTEGDEYFGRCEVTGLRGTVSDITITTKE
jgi:hypothetical protein